MRIVVLAVGRGHWSGGGPLHLLCHKMGAKRVVVGGAVGVKSVSRAFGWLPGSGSNGDL